jgi:hypothetical protein
MEDRRCKLGLAELISSGTHDAARHIDTLRDPGVCRGARVREGNRLAIDIDCRARQSRARLAKPDAAQTDGG